MKVLALVFLAIALFEVRAYSESDLDATDRFCLQKLSLDKSVLINSYDENNLIQEGSPLINTFIECAWEKDAVVNSDGSVNYDALKNYVEDKAKVFFPAKDSAFVANEGIKACKDVTGSSNGDTYVKVYNCLYSKIASIVNN